MFDLKLRVLYRIPVRIKRRIILTLIILLPPLHVGFINSYPSVANSQMSLPIDQLSWFSSIANLFAPLGAIFAGIIIDKFGRKPAIICCFVPSTIGWLLQYIASNKHFALLLLGRALVGFNAGASPYPSQVYATECIARDHLRLKEALSLSVVTALGLGELSIYLLGYMFDFQQLCAIFTVTSLLSFVVGYVFILESPLWLYYNGRSGDAEWVEKKLAYKQSILQSRVTIKETTVKETTDIDSHLFWRLTLLRQSNVYRPLLIMTSLIILTKLIGGTVLTTYLIDIMNGPESASTQRTYNFSTIAQALVLAANILCSFLVPVVGVKISSLVSAFGLVVGLILLANSDNALAQGSVAIRVIGVWLSVFTIHFGISSVLKVVLSEAFPLYAKGFGCVPTIAFNLCGALVLKIYPYLAEEFGSKVFYGCAVFTVVYAIIFHIFVPETVGNFKMCTNLIEFSNWPFVPCMLNDETSPIRKPSDLSRQRHICQSDAYSTVERRSAPAATVDNISNGAHDVPSRQHNKILTVLFNNSSTSSDFNFGHNQEPISSTRSDSSVPASRQPHTPHFPLTILGQDIKTEGKTNRKPDYLPQTNNFRMEILKNGECLQPALQHIELKSNNAEPMQYLPDIVPTVTAHPKPTQSNTTQSLAIDRGTSRECSQGEIVIPRKASSITPSGNDKSPSSTPFTQAFSHPTMRYDNSYSTTMPSSTPITRHGGYPTIKTRHFSTTRPHEQSDFPITQQRPNSNNRIPEMCTTSTRQPTFTDQYNETHTRAMDHTHENADEMNRNNRPNANVTVPTIICCPYNCSVSTERSSFSRNRSHTVPNSDHLCNVMPHNSCQQAQLILLKCQCCELGYHCWPTTMPSVQLDPENIYAPGYQPNFVQDYAASYPQQSTGSHSFTANQGSFMKMYPSRSNPVNVSTAESNMLQMNLISRTAATGNITRGGVFRPQYGLMGYTQKYVQNLPNSSMMHTN